MIADVLHFSFTVSDIERSVDWYTRVLGLELVHRQRQQNAYTQKLVGIDGAVLEVAQFRLPGVASPFSTHMLELIEYVEGSDPTLAGLPTNRVGVAHLALLVTDIEARYERMAAEGVRFSNPPVLITAGANEGGRACYLTDPDGITIELMQFSDARATTLGIPGSSVRDAVAGERDITGHTSLCFVIADPVAQLRTPSALNSLWSERGFDGVALPAHVAPDALPAFLGGLRANRSVLGAVVTVPHKKSVVPLCDELGPNARLVGAVNAIRRTASGTLIGETFDGLGFVAGLRSQGIEPRGMRVVLAGAGGAASSVAVALIEAGVERVDIVNRTESRGRDLVDHLRGAFPDRDIGFGSHRSADATLFVNATSNGMEESDVAFLPPELIPEGAIAADVVMSAELTPFLRGAFDRGIAVHEGRHMLAGQLALIADYLEAPVT